MKSLFQYRNSLLSSYSTMIHEITHILGFKGMEAFNF